MLRLFRCFLIIVFLSLHTVPLNAQFSLNIYSDKEEYSYGEPITIYSRLKNESDSTHEIWFGCYQSMQAEFYLDDFSSLNNTAGLTLMEQVIFHPGTERIYKWIISPERYGFPNFSGSHKLVGIHTSFPNLVDSSFFYAPKYYGGFIDVDYYTINRNSVDSILSANNFLVIDSSSYSFNASSYAKLNIAGHSLDSTISALLETGLFKEINPDHFTMYESAYITAINESDSQNEIDISNPYPNPFNPSTKIRYSLPVSGNVDFKVYDVKGELIQTIKIRGQNSGSYDLTWNGKNENGISVPSGVYIYQLIISPDNPELYKRIKSGKMLLLK